MNKNKNKNSGTLGPAIAVVLGAGLETDGSASERTIVRTEAAVQIAKRYPELTVIVTGDGRTDTNRILRSHSEASCMAQILQRGGIARSRIRLEHQARDTMGNAILVAARYLLGQAPRKIYLVTSPFHAERALVMFRGVYGPDWDIELYASGLAEGDLPKGLMEAGGIQWARRFLETTTPGDFVSAIDRLLTFGKPCYRKMPWLKALASEKAA
jgi:uncharacterized SAM-binding protein YcdF (DUF218 family)